MAYTLWHCGILIGETDFEESGRRPPQYAGVFRPNDYGRQVFPRLSGLLTAASGLKDVIEARGLSEDEMTREQVANVLDTTRDGRKVLDIGRELSEVELRDPDGRSLAFRQIAFIDLAELAELSRKLDCNADTEWEALPPEAPQLIVSVTLRTGEQPGEEPFLPERAPRFPQLGPRHS